FFSSRRRHTRLVSDWVQTCALPISSEQDVLDYLIDRALRAQGLVSLDSICHLDAPRKAGVRRLLEARVRRKELVQVALDGAEKRSEERRVGKEGRTRWEGRR